jgi:anti-sigma factor RsiW
MTNDTHLTEEERQMLADGSLEPERVTIAEEHLRACAECAADVGRIRAVLKRAGESRAQAPSTNDTDELWPSIRARIEQRKVVPLPNGSANSPRRFRRSWLAAAGGIAAAALFTIWLARSGKAPAGDAAIIAADTGVALIAVVDSTHAYEQEAQALLNHFEVQRATMRPEVAKAFDHDLKVIDVAIAELQGAIANDPANPALRRLLASSFRQKVDLLKRADNAGG